MQPVAIALLFVRVFIGGFYIYAAIPKIMEPLAFATSISHYGLVPDWTVNAIALTLPWVELIAGIALVIGFRTKVMAALCGIMLLVFTVAIAYAVMMGLKIDCGCFGSVGGEEVSWIKVGKNSAMIAGCVALWLRPKTWLSL